jgi:hypothetical protein
MHGTMIKKKNIGQYVFKMTQFAFVATHTMNSSYSLATNDMYTPVLSFTPASGMSGIILFTRRKYVHFIQSIRTRNDFFF